MDEQKLREARNVFDGIVTWLRQYNGDVDHAALVAECDALAHEAARALGRRCPRIVLGHGLDTLDFVACLLGTEVPADVAPAAVDEGDGV